MSNEAVNINKVMALLDRIEHLEAERKEINKDISEIWREAKNEGFTKELRKAHSIRKMKIEDRRILGHYCDALDLFS